MKNQKLLGELVSTIETIRACIADYGESVGKNETRTRQVLIDPLLRTLGWDISDPTQVTLEYEKGRGRADYALLGPDRPLAIIEAKRLGASLDDKHTDQALNYANTEDIDFIVVTNGDEWKMYGVFMRGAMAERLVMHLKIATTPVHETVLESLRLWDANMYSGEPAPAGTPIATPTTTTANDTASKTKNINRISATPKQSHRRNDEWTPLDDVKLPEAISGQGKKRIVLDIDGTQKMVRWQADILETVINVALIDSGKLTRSDCPVPVGNSDTKFLINTEPAHADKMVFDGSRKLSNGLYLFTGHAVAAMLRLLCNLLREFGITPNTVRVRVENN